MEDNHIVNSIAYGIYVAGPNTPSAISPQYASTNNFIIKNSVIGNGTNNYYLPQGYTYQIPFVSSQFIDVNNVFGPILNDQNGVLTNSSPWGNFSF